MRFKGNQPLYGTPRPDPDQKEVQYPHEVQPEDFSTIEVISERENVLEDEANVKELERTSKDLWGRSSQQTDGAVPTDPPLNDPVRRRNLDTPRRPPKHNI